MIIGIGSDIINIDSIAGLHEKFGENFLEKIFTINEVSAAGRYNKTENQKAIFAHYAKRFAAKEAFAKALGFGIGSEINFLDIEVKNDANGKPNIEITQKITDLLSQKSSAKNFIVHLTLSDDAPYATAFVVVEAA